MLKRLILVGCASLAALSSQGVGQPRTPGGVLALIQPGQWSLKSSDDPGENRSLCVSDPSALLQIRHGAAMCSRFVIANQPRETTVHYTCPAKGHGRTTLRIVTAKVVQIESQGIVDKQPFVLTMEGRRIGECPAVTGSLTR